MPFQVISPIFMQINGDSFTDAMKNFIKVNHHLQLENFIITDQIQNMMVNAKYFRQNGRHKTHLHYARRD